MDKYMECVRKFLAEHTPDYGYPDAHSLLEHIWCSYTQSNSVENEKIKKLFAELEDLALDQSEKMFDKIVELCEEYEHAAFLEGLHVGVRLICELQGSGKGSC